MFIPRLYTPFPLKIGETITFSEEAHHYLAKVLRLREKEPLILFNGEGGEYHAEFSGTSKKSQATILSFHDINRESPLSLHLGQGLAKGDRMDFVIQKATELGVTHITPLLTKRTAVKWEASRSEKRLQHWQNIIISACEQCGRTKLPILYPPQLLNAWIAAPFTGSSLLFDPNASLSLKTAALRTSSMRLAIGPESGWGEEEIEAMLQHGFAAYTLGPRWLRTETAGMAALSLLQGLYGDLG